MIIMVGLQWEELPFVDGTKAAASELNGSETSRSTQTFTHQTTGDTNKKDKQRRHGTSPHMENSPVPKLSFPDFVS